MAIAGEIRVAKNQDEKAKMLDAVELMAEIEKELGSDSELYEVPADQIEYRLERRGSYRPSYQVSVYVKGEFKDAAGFYRCSCGEVSELFPGQVPFCWHCGEEWTNKDLFD